MKTWEPRRLTTPSLRARPSCGRGRAMSKGASGSTRAVRKAETKFIKARADYQFRIVAQENPELAKNAATRYWHRQKLKRQYAKQTRQATKQAAKQGAKAAEKTAAATEKLAEQAAALVKKHPVGTLAAVACVLLLLSLQSCASSLVSLGNAAAGTVGSTTYPARDGDMLEADYCALEAELQDYHIWRSAAGMGSI